MKNIYLFGATGSIGMQTIDVIKQYKDEMNLIAVTVGNNIEELENILSSFDSIKYVCVKNENDYEKLSKKYTDIKFFYGDKGLEEIANKDEPGIMVNALVGYVGLKPTIKAIEAKKDICLANKETLVMAGEIIMDKIKEHNVSLLPIDSEHSAILQCLEKDNLDKIEKITITASGGSFRNKTREELKNVTKEDALNHPNWSMGNKITIDSATMMNKGFEVIEAYYMFLQPIEKIETIIHEESIIHSMVSYVDGSTKAHLGNPDMRTPILYSLTYPNRLEHKNKEEFSLSKIRKLSFREMDFDRFPCIKYAYDSIKKGGIIPVVLNAANEVAVDLFLNDKISFLEIEEIIEKEIYNTKNILNPTIEEIIEVDKEVRKSVYNRY